MSLAEGVDCGAGVGTGSGSESAPRIEAMTTPAKMRANGISEKANICHVLKTIPGRSGPPA